MRILVCLTPFSGHVQPLLALIDQFIKQGHTLDIIIDELFQSLLKNCEGINQILTHPTLFSQDQKSNFQVDPSIVNLKGILDQNTITGLSHMLFYFSKCALPFIMGNVNPQDYQFVIMDSLAIYAIPFIQKNNLKFIVSQSAYMTNEMISEIKSLTLPEVIKEYEYQFGVNLNQKEFMFSLDYANKVIVHSSKLFYETPLNEKFIYLMDTTIKEQNNNKSLENLNSIVYISLGTIFNNNFVLFKLLIDYFAHKYYQVIVTLGNNQETYNLLKNSINYQNVSLELWVDQKQVLKTASLFVTHSGYNGVKEAILSNTPMITIPQNSDQPYISKRLEQLGVSIELTEYSTQCLDAIFNNIKDNYEKFQSQIKIVQESFEKVMTPKQFVEQF